MSDDDRPRFKPGTQLTESDDGHAGLTVAEEFGDFETARYRPGVLSEWADELADIDEPVEVAIAPADGYHGPRDIDAPLALVARVPETDVICFAAPLVTPDDADDDGGSDDGAVVDAVRASLSNWTGWFL